MPLDGFAKHQSEKRVIRGRILKFVDARLSVDGQPFSNDQELLVQDVAQIGQYFPKDGGPPESFFIDDENPISRIDELNANLPDKDCKIGLDGKPEKWKLNDVIYLIKENDGSVFTMINSTVGLRIAVEILCDQVETTRKLHSNMPVLPVVKVGSVLMKTGFGMKARPSFEVVKYKGLAAERPLLKEVPALTASEIVQDCLPPAPKPKDAPWDDPIDDLTD